jgi:hypothetical protein
MFYILDTLSFTSSIPFKVNHQFPTFVFLVYLTQVYPYQIVTSIAVWFSKISINIYHKMSTLRRLIYLAIIDFEWLSIPYNKNELDALFNLYFVSHFYMFRGCYCPSSGGITVYIQRLVRVIRGCTGMKVSGSDIIKLIVVEQQINSIVFRMKRSWYGWVFRDRLGTTVRKIHVILAGVRSEIQIGYIPERKWRNLHCQGHETFHYLVWWPFTRMSTGINQSSVST